MSLTWVRGASELDLGFGKGRIAVIKVPIVQLRCGIQRCLIMSPS